MDTYMQNCMNGFTENEHEEFEAARNRGYLLKLPAVTGSLIRAYASWCGKGRTPFVTVSEEGVMFWLVRYSLSLTQQGVEELSALFREYGLAQDNYTIDAKRGEIRAVLPEDREPLAREITLTLRIPGVVEDTELT